MLPLIAEPPLPTVKASAAGLTAAPACPVSEDSTKVSVSPGLTVKVVPLTRYPGFRGSVDDAGVEVSPSLL